MILQEKDLLEKPATINRFKNSPLGSELKKQTKNNAEKQYKKLDKVNGFNKRVLNKKHENSDWVCNNFHSNKFSITDDEFNELSDDTKYKDLQKFFKK